MLDHYAQNDHGRFQSGSQVPQSGFSRTPAQPPAYGSLGEEAGHQYSGWDPRGWSLKNKIFLAVGIIVVIIAVIVGAVLGVRANRYPNYSSLDYSLVDTYSGSNFFDNFEYFTDTDPANGFVQ
jgi:hypothetical protein